VWNAQAHEQYGVVVSKMNAPLVAAVNATSGSALVMAGEVPCFPRSGCCTIKRHTVCMQVNGKPCFRIALGCSDEVLKEVIQLPP